jgi:hypothetical protein
MLANEMKFNFMLKYDALFEFSGPAYDDRQISYILTSAQTRVFMDRYYAPANKNQRGFEADEKKRRELEQLIKNASISAGDITDAGTTGAHPNGNFYYLPSAFLYAIEESAKLTGTTVFVPVKPVRHDEYVANVNNPYKQPFANLVWRMDYSRVSDPIGNIVEATWEGTTKKRIELITHTGASINDYRLRYLRMPPNIVVDEYTPANQVHCVLDKSIHETIVDEAVKIAKAAVKPEEYQIAAVEKDSSDD